MCLFGNLQNFEWLVKIMIFAKKKYCWVHDIPALVALQPGPNFCDNYIFWTPKKK
jgi:hypothetical protein